MNGIWLWVVVLIASATSTALSVRLARARAEGASVPLRWRLERTLCWVCTGAVAALAVQQSGVLN